MSCSDTTSSIPWAAQPQGRTPMLALLLWGPHGATQSHWDIILNLSACNPFGVCYKMKQSKAGRLQRLVALQKIGSKKQESIQCWKSVEEIRISNPTPTCPTLYLWSVFSINSNKTKLWLLHKFFSSENTKAPRQIFESFLWIKNQVYFSIFIFY